MQIDGKKIASILQKQLKKDFSKLKNKSHKPRLTTLLIGQSPDQLSFVKIKQKIAKKIGVAFDFIYLKQTPSFEKLMQLIKSISADPKTTGIIIQQPLPPHLATESIYDIIDTIKEIEGHKHKTTYLPPLGLGVLTILKYIFSTRKVGSDLFVNINRDTSFFKRIFKNKKVVLVGRGLTGGKPIGHTLSTVKINYLQIHSQTPNKDEYLKDADIIISAVGKKVILPESLKPEVILINIGLRRENKRLKGDYEEKEVKNIASYYTPTPGGIGPIDVVYLYKNLLEAAKQQK